MFNYQHGNGLKLDAAVRLAEACNVSLEWLATARLQMASDKAIESMPTPLPPPIAGDIGVAWEKIDALTEILLTAIEQLQALKRVVRAVSASATGDAP